MNYEFHVGDYVETIDGRIGAYSQTFTPQSRVEAHFIRIGAYDFTKREKKKIERLEDNLPVEGRIGDKTIEFEQYFSDGKYVKFVYNGKMIDKINELVNAVNELRDKDDNE